jgi:hypothetical protein
MMEGRTRSTPPGELQKAGEKASTDASRNLAIFPDRTQAGRN